jgi:formyl-CoA transferase
LGKPEWFEHADYKTNAERRENRDRLNGVIAEIIATKTSAEWVDALTAAGVPCGPIYKIDEMFADPQVQHLGIAQPLSTVPFGDTHAMGQPVQLTRTPSQLVGSPPTRGEHTLEILDELGINADQAATLKDNSIV